MIWYLMIFAWLVLLFVLLLRRISNTNCLVVLYRTSTNKRRRGDQRRYSDRDHVNWSERQHGDDSQGVRQLRQTHNRTVPAQGFGPVLARGLSQMRLLRLSAGWSRIHVVHQSQPDTLQKGLPQVNRNRAAVICQSYRLWKINRRDPYWSTAIIILYSRPNSGKFKEIARSISTRNPRRISNSKIVFFLIVFPFDICSSVVLKNVASN